MLVLEKVCEIEHLATFVIKILVYFRKHICLNKEKLKN